MSITSDIVILFLGSKIEAKMIKLFNKLYLKFFVPLLYGTQLYQRSLPLSLDNKS